MTEDDDFNRHVDFARELAEIARDDVRQVYLRVTGILGLVIVFVTQLPFARLVGLPLWTRWSLLAGVVFAVASAALFFYYLSMLHLARLDIARYIRDGRPMDVEEIWAGRGETWVRHGWAFECGRGLSILSAALFGLTLAVLLNLVP